MFGSLVSSVFILWFAIFIFFFSGLFLPIFLRIKIILNTSIFSPRRILKKYILIWYLSFIDLLSTFKNSMKQCSGTTKIIPIACDRMVFNLSHPYGPPVSFFRSDPWKRARYKFWAQLSVPPSPTKKLISYFSFYFLSCSLFMLMALAKEHIFSFTSCSEK